jgi:uncharacterized protein (TIGR02594 family)
MRFILAPLATLCLLFSTPVLAQGGPDSIYVPGKGYVEPYQLTGHKQARHFGGYIASTSKRKRKSRSTKVAGKRFTPSPSVSYHSSAAPWLADAKRYVGRGNPTARRNLWCARFINDRLARSGRKGTGSDLARSFVNGGQRLAAPRPGAIAVYARGRNGTSGHAAIVESVEGNTVTLISGNCGRKGVCRYTRSVGSAIAYVWPS